MLPNFSLMSWNWKKTAVILKWVLLVYGLVGIAVFYLQQWFFFRPLPLSRDHDYAFGIPYAEMNLPYNESVNINIVRFLAHPQVPNKGIILYFHGNRRNISWYARYAPPMTVHGYEVWMIDYPGFGKTTGPLEEKILYDQALQLYKLARKKAGADSLIIYGKSMGTGIAAWLAGAGPARRLILETPYYSLSSVAADILPIYPWERMIRIKIPTHEHLSGVSVPVTIFHGRRDGVISYRNARRLLPFLKNTDEFVTIEGGRHNDLMQFPLFRKKLDSLLSR